MRRASRRAHELPRQVDGSKLEFPLRGRLAPTRGRFSFHSVAHMSIELSTGRFRLDDASPRLGL